MSSRSRDRARSVDICCEIQATVMRYPFVARDLGAFERFNDNHGAVATQGTGLQGYGRDLFVPVTVVFFDFNVGSGRRGLEELPA